MPHDDLVEQWLDRFDDPDSIDEDPEYTINLGAETPLSICSFNDPVPSPPPRVFTRRTSLPKIPRRRNSIGRDCGICFEFAVKPARVLCCGTIYCQEHITDWLHGPSSDGRCPSCSAPCSNEANILSLVSPTLNVKPSSPPAHPSQEEIAPSLATRGRSQSTSTSTSKQSQLSESTLSSSSDGNTNSSVLGLGPTPEENFEEENDGQHWLAYALGFGHMGQSRSAGPSPYPFIHPGSSTAEVIARLTSVMGLTLLFYALFAS